MAEIDGVFFSPEDLQTVAKLLAPTGFPHNSDDAVGRLSGFKADVIKQVRTALFSPPVEVDPEVVAAARKRKGPAPEVSEPDAAYIVRRARIGDDLSSIAARLDIPLETVKEIVDGSKGNAS